MAPLQPLSECLPHLRESGLGAGGTATGRNRPRDREEAPRLRSLLILLFIIVVLVAAGLRVADAPGGLRGTGPVRALATAVTLSTNGISPTTISLVWTESNDTSFVSYTVQTASSSSGPWYNVQTITNQSVTGTYIGGIRPAILYWLQILDTNSSGSASSNELLVFQPASNNLSFDQTTASSVLLLWNNNASYGGYVAFGSYQVMESVNWGPYSTLSTITNEATRTLTVSGLNASTTYRFAVVTTDVCNGCPGGTYPSSFWSNEILLRTSAPLSLRASIAPPFTDVGLTVSFNSTVAGGTPPFTYSWTFGDGTSGSEPNMTHAYGAFGVYQVNCTVIDALGSSSNASASVQVSLAPSIIAAVNRTKSSPGTSLSFSAAVTGGKAPYSFTWTFGDGFSGMGSPVTHAYANPGTYVASVSLKDSNNGTATGSITVNVAFLTVLATASSTLTDAGDAVMFLAIASGGAGGPYGYSWDFGDGGVSQGASATHSFDTAGTYTVRATAIDALGAQANSSFSVLVASALSVTATVNRTASAPGNLLSFSAVGTGGAGNYTYTWSFGDTSSALGASAAHAFDVPGAYRVTVVLEDLVGGTASGTLDVTVAYLVVTATVSATSAAPGSTITFSATGSGGAEGPYSYRWDFGDGTTGTGAKATHAYPVEGTFTARVTITDPSGATNTTEVAPVTVQGAPPPSAQSWYIFAGVAVVAVVVAVAATLFVMRRRS